MENQTSFDLNQNIQSWRENLGQSPAFQRENLDELETHLRDSINRLQTAGLSAEEAFGVAIKRAGTATSLATEFGKVNSQAVWMDRIFWMLVGLQLWLFVVEFVRQMATLSLAVVNYLAPQNSMFVTGTTQMVWATVNLAAMVASLGICRWLILQKGPAIAGWMKQSSWRNITRVMAVVFVVGVVLDHLPFMLWESLLSRHVNRYATMPNFFQNLIYPVSEAVVFFFITLVLARKRFKMRPAE